MEDGFANSIINLTDPSGKFAAQALGLLVGGVAGAASSGYLAWRMHGFANNNQCGCEMKQWAQQTNRNSFVGVSAIIGALSGAVFGFLATIPGAPQILTRITQLLGAYGAEASIGSMIRRGIDICNTLSLLLSLLGAFSNMMPRTIPFKIPLNIQSNVQVSVNAGGTAAFRFAPAIVSVNVQIPGLSAVQSSLLSNIYFMTRGGEDGNTSNKDSGPGTWKNENESMSDVSEDYQAQIAGENRRGQVYEVNGVKFDGYDESRKVLLAAKGRYDQFVDNNGNFKQFFTGAGEFLKQAQRQMDAAGDYNIEWHTMQPNTATAIQRLFQQRGITRIRVIHTPAL